MGSSPDTEIECLLCRNFKSDAASLFDHQLECQKLPEHQAKSDELMERFVTSLAIKHAEEFASDMFNIDAAAHYQKLSATRAKSDKKKEKIGVKSVNATGTSAAITTGKVDRVVVKCDRVNEVGNRSNNNKKGWSRGRGRGGRGIQTRGRGCGGNDRSENFEQVVDVGIADIVSKKESEATTDRKYDIKCDRLSDRTGGSELSGFMKFLQISLLEAMSSNGFNISSGSRLTGNAVTRQPPEIGSSRVDLMLGSSNAQNMKDKMGGLRPSKGIVIKEPQEQSHAGYSDFQEGNGKQIALEDFNKLALKRGIKNSRNVYGEGSSSGNMTNDTDEVEGETILYKGKIANDKDKIANEKDKITDNKDKFTNDSDEVEGEIILYKGRNVEYF